MRKHDLAVCMCDKCNATRLSWRDGVVGLPNSHSDSLESQDKEEFEKWWMRGFVGVPFMSIIKYKNIGRQSALDGWEAAIKYERERVKRDS